jgi:hypothetical protein
VAVWRYSALTILLECGAKWNGNGDNVVEERFFRGHKKWIGAWFCEQIYGQNISRLAPANKDDNRRANSTVVGQEFVEAGRKDFEISRPVLWSVM